MQIFLVYDHANELQEVHLLEAAAETRAGHFGGTYEGRTVEPLPAYTSEELQTVIDDLDLAQQYCAPYDAGDANLVRLVRSLKIASAILVMFPEEALKCQDEYVSARPASQ